MALSLSLALSRRYDVPMMSPSDIVTKDSIDNAFILDLAMGGSTNTVLHTLALAQEAGINYPVKRINELSETINFWISCKSDWACKV